MAKKAKKLIRVEDLSDVDTRLPAGVYTVKVAEVVGHKGPNANGVMWTFEVIEGKHAGSKTRPHFTATQGAGRYRFKQVLSALNYDIPDDDFDLDPDEVVDGELVIELAEREYEKDDGTKGISSDVVGYVSLEDAPEEEEEKPKRGKRKAKDEEEEEEEEEKPARRGRGKSKDTEEADEEEEAEEKPSRRGASKAAAKKTSKKKSTVTEDEINEMDTSELEALVEEHDLDVDLSKVRSLSKQRAAVIKAAGDLLE